jgi:hypothetical protein
MMSRVSVSLGNAEREQARRSGASSWRDLRLWIGVALVAVSALVGARLLDRADDTVALWAVRGEMAPGELVTADRLVARDVHFVDPADAERYVRVGAALPTQARLRRGLGTGELLPRSAVGTPEETGLLSVPISMPGLALPPEVAPGSVVDVWVTAENDRGRSVARPVLREVVVIAAPPGSGAFGDGGDRQLVLGVPAEQEDDLGTILAAVGERALTVVTRG